MSSGNQLREFHFVDDDIDFVLKTLNGNRLGSEIHAISHGNVHKIKDVAIHLYAAANKGNLLKIGVLPSPKVEIYDLDFFSNFSVNQFNPRNAMTAMEEALLTQSL
jgi:nucleoside-diphosphate-sugar epimerase